MVLQMHCLGSAYSQDSGVCFVEIGNLISVHCLIPKVLAFLQRLLDNGSSLSVLEVYVVAIEACHKLMHKDSLRLVYWSTLFFLREQCAFSRALDV